jgi:hypothetical protein
MYKKTISLTLTGLVFCLVLTNAANATEPDLAGWWTFDEMSGNIAADSSDNGNDGTLQEGAVWTAGQINGAVLLDGSSAHVELPIGVIIGSLTDSTFATWVNWAGGAAYQRIFDFNSGTGINMWLTPDDGGGIRFAITTGGWSVEEQIHASILESEWHHIAVIIDAQNSIHRLYVDGQEIAQNTSGTLNPSDLGETTDNWLGRSPYGDATFNGAIDDFYIYSRVLLPEEIKLLMEGGGLDRGLASEPYPEDGQTDVLRDVTLSWKPGKTADKHNVYVGTSFDDVNNADISSTLLVGPGLDVAMLDLGRLEFGRTWFWRVDEVNAPPDSTVIKGDVWSFMVETLAYPIPSQNITATASSQSEGQGPEKTTDGSGLTGDLHSTELTSMWFSQPSDPGQVWIQYDFDKAFKLHEMLVWNYNGQTISSLYGFEAVTIEYSPDGETWTQLDNVPPFSIADGDEGYAPNTTVAFDDMAVKSVRITANNNHGGGTGWFNQYGLSEVRFMYIPVNARMPDPESGTTDIAIDTTLSWRPGREAAEHNVYISTDQQAVIDGTATVTTVSQVDYNPPTLDLSSTYYWRIDEVNSAQSPSTWQSDIWNFSTQQYLVVDDFESYNDITEGQEGSRLVYIIWADGVGNNANGSTMGYFEGSSMETVNVHSDSQSAPLFYDNTSASLSEIVVNTSNLPIGSNWSKGSPQTLILWIHGDTGNAATDRLYAKIGNSKVTYDGDIARPIWMPWSIDLAGINLSNVSTMTIGIERVGAPGGSGVIYLDDIRLYGQAPEFPEQIWIEAEAYDSIAAPMMLFDDPNASGGQYIMKDPDAAESISNPPDDGLVTYSFTVAGGTYTLAGRVITNGGNDAFWLRIPGATTQTANHSSGWINWNAMTQEDVWGMEDVWSSNDGGEVVEFTMPAGTYTLELKHKDDESQLDAWLITKID